MKEFYPRWIQTHQTKAVLMIGVVEPIDVSGQNVRGEFDLIATIDRLVRLTELPAALAWCGFRKLFGKKSNPEDFQVRIDHIQRQPSMTRQRGNT
jgi:hypothetical protein